MLPYGLEAPYGIGRMESAKSAGDPLSASAGSMQRQVVDPQPLRNAGERREAERRAREDREERQRRRASSGGREARRAPRRRRRNAPRRETRPPRRRPPRPLRRRPRRRGAGGAAPRRAPGPRGAPVRSAAPARPPPRTRPRVRRRGPGGLPCPPRPPTSLLEEEEEVDGRGAEREEVAGTQGPRAVFLGDARRGRRAPESGRRSGRCRRWSACRPGGRARRRRRDGARPWRAGARPRRSETRRATRRGSR